MSLRQYKFSPLLPYKMVPIDYGIVGTRYNSPDFDRTWFSEQNVVRGWQEQVEYAQLRQTNDRMSFQFWSTSNVSDATLYLYNCSSEIVKTDVLSKLQNGLVNFSVTEDGYTYNVWTFTNNLYWNGLDEGNYYIYINCHNVTFDDYFISEPIYVKEKHEGSGLLEYSHDENKDYIIFEQTNQKFSKRIIGDVLDFTPLVERTVFLDNGYDTTQLRANAYRGWTLYAGGNGSLIPDYEIDILNYVFTLKGIKWEKKGYTPADGAAFKKTDNPNYPMYSAAIELREPKRKVAYTLLKGDLLMFDYGGIYPFSPVQMLIGSDDVFDFVYKVAGYIFDDTSRDAYVTTLNSQAVLQGIDGIFSVDGTKIIYTLGNAETYTQTDNVVLDKFTIVTHTTTAISQNLNFYSKLNGALSGLSYFSLVYADAAAVLNYGVLANFESTEFTHSFAVTVTGTSAHYIFHDNTISNIELKGDYLTAVSGTTPSLMQSFSLTDSPKITSFSMIESLQNSCDSLLVLHIKNNVILTALRYYYRSTATPKKVFSKLIALDCIGNNMSSTNLDNFYIDMWNSYGTDIVGIPLNGISNTTGQLTSAHPTATSAAQRLSLSTTKGWILLT